MGTTTTSPAEAPNLSDPLEFMFSAPAAAAPHEAVTQDLPAVGVRHEPLTVGQFPDNPHAQVNTLEAGLRTEHEGGRVGYERTYAPKIQEYRAIQDLAATLEPRYRQDMEGGEIHLDHWVILGDRKVEHALAQRILELANPATWLMARTTEDIFTNAALELERPREFDIPSGTPERVAKRIRQEARVHEDRIHALTGRVEREASKVLSDVGSITLASLRRLVDLSLLARRQLSNKGINPDALIKARGDNNYGRSSQEPWSAVLAAVEAPGVPHVYGVRGRRRARRTVSFAAGVAVGRAVVKTEGGYQDKLSESEALRTLLHHRVMGGGRAVVSTPRDIALLLYPEAFLGGSTVTTVTRAGNIFSSDAVRRLSPVQWANALRLAEQIATVRHMEAVVAERTRQVLRHQVADHRRLMRYSHYPDTVLASPDDRDDIARTLFGTSEELSKSQSDALVVALECLYEVRTREIDRARSHLRLRTLARPVVGPEPDVNPGEYVLEEGGIVVKRYTTKELMEAQNIEGAAVRQTLRGRLLNMRLRFWSWRTREGLEDYLRIERLRPPRNATELADRLTWLGGRAISL